MYDSPSKEKGQQEAFDIKDEIKVKRTQLGVWDLYEERHPTKSRLPGSSKAELGLEMIHTLPYVWRMIVDIGSIKKCWSMLFLYLLLTILGSLVPAATLWYSGQLLQIVQLAVDKRTVDKKLLIRVAGGRIACTVVARILHYLKNAIGVPLNSQIKQYYSVHIFHAVARLDVPTFSDPAVRRQMDAAASLSGQTVCWDTITLCSGFISTIVRLTSQVSVLISVLRDQPDGPILAVLCFGQSTFQWFTGIGAYITAGVWAATTTNEDFLRMEGMKSVIEGDHHRQEIVAGDMSEYLTGEYRKVVQSLGDKAGQFHEMVSLHRYRDKLSFTTLLQAPFSELPQIAFTLRAVQYPSSIPLSLASLHLIRENASTFSGSLYGLLHQTSSIAEQLASVRKLYQIEHIANKVVNGGEVYAEDDQNLRDGISVEFRNVFFKYPGAERYALINVSFKISPGQLCIIVGANGSGKSTILKLIARIYDPAEGTILIDGRDIQSLNIQDLRRAISVLFQDYTHFPLSIKENIGIGDPKRAKDENKIREAARLGGAGDFIDQLPNKFDTYLHRPVQDVYSDLPEGTKMLFGRPVDFSAIRGAAYMESTTHTSLSGGQLQRLALSRTFMRSITDGSKVGLLLFDEPSASLDPTAEHDLFERLRNLRGNKTMIFSSHRFGNLTRHADLILYMNGSSVVEEGTHDELLGLRGEYARIWMLQAKAFL